jgi:hypothetical protein
MRCAILCAFLPALSGSVPPQEPRPMNALANETSPYLLQHKNNPVDWQPWGEAALARAKAEDKPIFLSIGYSACHWCHVMEHESFENPEIAALMNKWFVNIKVDREERPDLDEIYMTAVQRMTGSGGWPMSVWLTPDLQPFFGGTYFPPEDRYGRAGFPRVLEHVHKLWTERRADVEGAAKEMTEDLRRLLAPEAKPGDPQLAWCDQAVRGSLSRFDAEHGGFGHPPHFAPKFPHASEIALLLRHHARTGDPESLRAAEITLEKMARGGLYDQLGGGFHRYSTDRQWLVPHFEKMLYDNALLARVYAEAFQLTRKPLYATVVRETLDYLLREMQHPDGGLYSTTDADSEGVEGKFFVWSKSEVDALLGGDAALACARWGITEGGNWEHTNVLWAAKTHAELAAQFALEEKVVADRLARARTALLARRSQRVPPGTDDKVLTAWNGMAIAALAIGHQVFDEPRWLEGARRAAEFVLRDLRADGRLLRTWRDGRAQLAGYLEDYGFLADGLLCLFEADFDPRWLRHARELLTEMRTHFEDDAQGSFFFTADDHEELLARSKSISESSTPSGVAVATLALLRAALLCGDRDFEASAERALRAHHAELARMPLISPSLLLALELHLGDPKELVIVGAPGDAAVRAFLARARLAFPPHHAVTLLHDGNRSALLELAPIVEGKELVGGKPAAYLCRRGVCEAPVTDPARLAIE